MLHNIYIWKQHYEVQVFESILSKFSYFIFQTRIRSSQISF